MAKILFLVFFMTCSMAYAATLKDSYQHFSSLDQNDNYLMYWSINETSQMIHFAVSVKTLGWVGLGFSPYTGRMPGSDIVIGWVDGQGPHLEVSIRISFILKRLFNHLYDFPTRLTINIITSILNLL